MVLFVCACTFQPSDTLWDKICAEFVPSAVDTLVAKSHGTKGAQGGEFLRLPKHSVKPFVDPKTGELYVKELTKDIVDGLLNDPGNEGKAIIIPSKDLQGVTMHCGPERTYIEEREFTMLSDLYGKGGFGETQWIKDRISNTDMIRKKIKKPVFKSKELLALDKLRESRHFPSLHGFMSDKDTISVFMEYGGNSFNKVVKNADLRCLLSNEDIVDITSQGFHALQYLRIKHIIHMDIKPENLCLMWCNNSRLHLMVCDLGSCEMTSVSQKVAISWCTLAYMTPEMCRKILSTRPGYQFMWQKEEKMISFPSDVYQLSASILYLIIHKHWQEVHPALRPPALGPELTKRLPCYIQSLIATRPELLQELIKPEWDERLKTIFTGAFHGLPNQRITPQQALDYLSMAGTKSVCPTETKSASPTGTKSACPTGTKSACPTGTKSACPTGTKSVCPTGTKSVCPTGTKSACQTGASTCSSRKRGSSSQNLHLNALCIKDEPPEKHVDRDAGEDLSAPGNLPDLPNCSIDKSAW